MVIFEMHQSHCTRTCFICRLGANVHLVYCAFVERIHSHSFALMLRMRWHGGVITITSMHQLGSVSFEADHDLCVLSYLVLLVLGSTMIISAHGFCAFVKNALHGVCWCETGMSMQLASTRCAKI